ncbi:MAG: hypothetical protein IPQ07_01020 [Myxococcales bacterium]|nr:hypothetical protein [Myxococcales bacterium]
MADWVFAVERAYVAAATGVAPTEIGAPSPPSLHDELLPKAYAAAGAVASRYLAVGTPRSLGLVVHGAESAEAGALSHAAHATWFLPRDVRVTGLGADGLAHSLGGHVVPLEEALACDIVCVHAPIAIAAAQLRRGTHVNVLANATLDSDLTKLATVTREVPGLGELAAGLVDGRQLDELTVFVIGDGSIALRALHAL